MKNRLGSKSFTDLNNYFDEESEQRFVEEYGANREVQLRDGR